MTALQVHNEFTDIQGQSKITKALIQFNVSSSTGTIKATFRLEPTQITLFTNQDIDSGVAIDHSSNYFSSEHPSRDWQVVFAGKNLDTMQSDISILFDTLLLRKDEIIEILTADYNQEIADLKQHIKQDEQDIEAIEHKHFILEDL